MTPRGVDDVLAALSALAPPLDPARVVALDAALAAVARLDDPSPCVPALLAVLERFEQPDEPLWGVLHALEDIPGYEPRLVESVRRAPSELGLTMVSRLLNDDVDEVDGMPLVALLEEIALDARRSEAVRAEARELAVHHGSALAP